MSLTPQPIHSNHDRIAAQAKYQAGAFGFLVQDHASAILHPQIAGARGANRKAIPGLGVRDGKIHEAAVLINVPLSLDAPSPPVPTPAMLNTSAGYSPINPRNGRRHNTPRAGWPMPPRAIFDVDVSRQKGKKCDGCLPGRCRDEPNAPGA